VVIRTDESKTYIKNSGTAGSMADFTHLVSPTGTVTTVDGHSGTVTANDIRDAVESATDSNTFTDADHTKLNSALTTSDLLDEDDFATDSPTKAASQQSVKAYIASQAYTHPNHSGEVTSSADGAQTIASNVVDEDNLKVSNSPTNGQFLQAQSGNTGGLTWADVAAGGSTVDLVADGALAIDDAVYVTSAGKAKKIALAQTENTPVVKATQNNNQASEDTMQNRTPGICYDPDRNRIHYSYALDNNSGRIVGYALDSNQLQATTSSDSAYKEGTLFSTDSDYHRLVYDTNTDRIVSLYARSSELRGRVISVASDGTYTIGTEQTIMNASAAWIDACFDPVSNKVLVVWSEESNSYHGACKLLTVDTSGTAPGTLTIGDLHRFEGSSSSNAKYCACIKDPDANKFIIAYTSNSDNQLHLQTATISSGSDMTFGTKVGCTDNSSEHTYWPRMCYDTVNDLIVVLYTQNPSGNSSGASRRLVAASVSGTAITFKTPDNLGSSAAHATKVGNHDIIWDPSINKAIAWHTNDNNTRRLYANKVYHSGNANDQYAYETQVLVRDDSHETGSDMRLMDACYTDKGQHYCFQKNNPDNKGYLNYISAAETALNSNGYDNIGFSKAAYSDGANATIKTAGNIVNNQSSLTIGANYYLQNDGTYAKTRQLGYGGFRAISATSGIITSGVNHNTYGSVVEEWYMHGNSFVRMSGSTYLNDNNWNNISGNSNVEMKQVALHYGKKGVKWTGGDLSNIQFPETGKWQIEWMGYVNDCKEVVTFEIYRSTNGNSGPWVIQGRVKMRDYRQENMHHFYLTAYLDIDDVVKNVCAIKCVGSGATNDTRISAGSNHREAGNKLVFTKIS